MAHRVTCSLLLMARVCHCAPTNARIGGEPPDRDCIQNRSCGVASAPLRLRVPAIGVDGAVSEYTQAMIDARDGFDPVTLDTIAWDTTIPGGIAGTDAVNTVYLYGHSWVDPAVFNGLKDLGAGAVAAVDTAEGTLCYVAQKTLTLDKAAYKTNDELTKIVAGRLVLVSCYRPVGYDPDAATVQNIVVILQLDRHATTAGC